MKNVTSRYMCTKKKRFHMVDCDVYGVKKIMKHHSPGDIFCISAARDSTAASSMAVECYGHN